MEGFVRRLVYTRRVHPLPTLVVWYCLRLLRSHVQKSRVVLSFYQYGMIASPLKTSQLQQNQSTGLATCSASWGRARPAQALPKLLTTGL